MKSPPATKFTDIDQAAHSGAFGNNPLPLPTDKQIAAGTFKKGKVSLYGLTIAIEQPQNSYRTGIDKNGNRWACRLAANYGYILRTKGNDGDHVDCFIGSYPQSDRVFIINQFVNGVFDEHKIMLAYPAVEFARSDYNFSYARGWDGLHSLVETSVKNFKWWLKNGDMSKPITAEQLPPESENDMKVFWDSANQPIGTNTAQLLYELRKIDADDGLLLDAVTVGDFILDADAGSVDFGVLLDSLHTPYSSLARVCSKIMLAMKVQQGKDSQGNPLLPVEATTEEPNPSGLETTFKRNGVVNLAAVFQLTDGQTFSIIFHNPDSTPGKLAATDTLIAWKFLLNKRDISIAVAPEKGEDLKLPEVAKRVMMLAEKNSAAFARANKSTAERVALIGSLKTEIAELEIEKTQAQADYEAAKTAYDEREINKATDPKQPFVATHTVNDDGVQVPVKMNDEGIWEAENGNEYENYDAEPITVANAVQSIGLNTDPITEQVTSMLSSEITADKENAHEYRKAAFDIIRSRYGNKPPVPVDTKDGQVVLVGMGGLKHVLKDGTPTWQEAIATLHAEEIIANAEYLGSEPDYKKRAEIKAVHRYGETIEIDGEKYGVVVVVMEASDGKRYYDHTVTGKNESPTGLLADPSTNEVDEESGRPFMELPADNVAQPENNATASFDAEIEGLRSLIGTPEFSDALDNLLDKLEAAGVDSQYEQVVSDIINQDAQAEMAKAGV